MIDLSQWRTSIGCFSSTVNCYVDREYISSTDNVLLHTVVAITVVCDVTVLQMFMYAVTVLLLILCGDIEVNLGPVQIVYPNCGNQVNIKKKSCECGFIIRNARGRKIGCTRTAGYKVSSGCSTSNELNVPMRLHLSSVHTELEVTRGRPASNADIKLDVSRGRPPLNADIEFNVSRGRTPSNADIELEVSRGRTPSNADIELEVSRG